MRRGWEGKAQLPPPRPLTHGLMRYLYNSCAAIVHAQKTWNDDERTDAEVVEDMVVVGSRLVEQSTPSGEHLGRACCRARQPGLARGGLSPEHW